MKKEKDIRKTLEAGEERLKEAEKSVMVFVNLQHLLMGILVSNVGCADRHSL